MHLQRRPLIHVGLQQGPLGHEPVPGRGPEGGPGRVRQPDQRARGQGHQRDGLLRALRRQGLHVPQRQRRQQRGQVPDGFGHVLRGHRS